MLISLLVLNSLSLDLVDFSFVFINLSVQRYEEKSTIPNHFLTKSWHFLTKYRIFLTKRWHFLAKSESRVKIPVFTTDFSMIVISGFYLTYLTYPARESFST